MKTATEIQATAIYRIISQNCWAVPSDSSTKMYKVCFDEGSSNWTCECKHGEVQASRGLAAHCKHVRAVQVSIVANKKATKPLPTLNGNRERTFEQAPSGCMVPMR